MTELKRERFWTAIEEGEIVEQSGYHQCRNCSCRLTTEKGAYRDVSVELNGQTVNYYHQNPIVVTDGERVLVHSCGWLTPTTKERINRYLPAGYRVFQRDFEWFVSTPDGETVEFEDGMVIEK